VYRTSRDGRFQIVNPALVQMLGYDSAEELYQVPSADLYWYAGDRDAYVRRMDSEGEMRNDGIRLAPQERHDVGRSVQRPRGAATSTAEQRLRGHDHRCHRAQTAETAVFQAKERAQVTLQSIGDAVITTDSTGASII
jgi:PAS domain-containing protein